MSFYKNIRIISILLVAVLLSTQTMAQVIASDERLNTDMEDYKSFSYADETSPFFVEIEDVVYQQKIENAVKTEMEAKGYEHKESNSDLLVAFRVLDGNAKYTGFENGSIEKISGGLEEVRERGYKEEYYLEPGTILISMIDADSQKLVWQGFASGLTDGYIYDDEDNEVKATVAKLFHKEFNYNSEK